MKKLIVTLTFITLTSLCYAQINNQQNNNTVEAIVINKIHVPSTEKSIVNDVLMVNKNTVTAERWLVLMTVDEWSGALNTMDNQELYDSVEIGQKITLNYNVVLSMGVKDSCSFQINNVAAPDGKVVKIWDKVYGR